MDKFQSQRDEFWKYQYSLIKEKVLSIPPIEKEYGEIEDDVRLVYELVEDNYPKKFSTRIERGKDKYVMKLVKEQVFVRLIKQTDTSASTYLVKEFDDKTYHLSNLPKSPWFQELVMKCKRYSQLYSYQLTNQDFEDVCSDAYIILQTVSPPPPLRQELSYFLSTTIAKSVLKDKKYRKMNDQMSLNTLTKPREKDKLSSELVSTYLIERKEELQQKKIIHKILRKAISLIPEKKRKYVLMLLKNKSKEEIANELSIQVSSMNDYLYDTKRAIVKQVEKSGTSFDLLKKKYKDED